MHIRHAFLLRLLSLLIHFCCSLVLITPDLSSQLSSVTNTSVLTVVYHCCNCASLINCTYFLLPFSPCTVPQTRKGSSSALHFQITCCSVQVKPLEISVSVFRVYLRLVFDSSHLSDCTFFSESEPFPTSDFHRAVSSPDLHSAMCCID
ncbi:hypothetical protein M758_9G148600 [Ceratodon purpureus]|nr:hypothetical protein M758_9G148600 [Ceratodon purpureus]